LSGLAARGRRLASSEKLVQQLFDLDPEQLSQTYRHTDSGTYTLHYTLISNLDPVTPAARQIY